MPICLNGHLDIEVNGETKRIGITRIHMEEDAGKLVHSGNTISDSKSSNVDYNRTGVPLLEIVSEPDIRSGAEAKAYVEKLRSILQYLEVSDGRMEEGSLRCDCTELCSTTKDVRIRYSHNAKNLLPYDRQILLNIAK